MYGYTIKIKQISGKINENKIPKKSLIIKSKKNDFRKCCF